MKGRGKCPIYRRLRARERHQFIGNVAPRSNIYYEITFCQFNAVRSLLKCEISSAHVNFSAFFHDDDVRIAAHDLVERVFLVVIGSWSMLLLLLFGFVFIKHALRSNEP